MHNGSGNPFAMPRDLEMYKNKMLDKEQKKSIQDQRVHIGKKGIKSNMEGKLRAFFKEPQMEDEPVDNKVKIVDAAKIAIKNRIRDKETMHDFVLKKREMFLF